MRSIEKKGRSMKTKKRKNKLNHIEKGVLTWVRVLFYIFVISSILTIILADNPEYAVNTGSDFWINMAQCFILYMINPVYKHFRRIEMKK